MEIAIDMGKEQSYVLMEENGKTVKEGYTQTSREGFAAFFGNVANPKIVVEAGSTLNRIANILDGYDITVAHPARVKLIAQSVKKTDKIDAHTIMDLYKKDSLPRSYLPERAVRDARDLCRDRALLVRQRTGIKNKIKYHAFYLGIPRFKGYGKKIMKRLKEESSLQLLVEQLDNINAVIGKYDEKIGSMVGVDSKVSRYARLMDTIPGIGKDSTLAIASEIGDIGRFPNEFHFFSYVGVVPRIYQSGDKEWRGHITKGNVFMKTTLLPRVCEKDRWRQKFTNSLYISRTVSSND